MCQTSRRLLVTVLCLVALPALAGEGRIPVFEWTEITKPGKYIVTRNLPFNPTDAIIRINVSGVDLDLNGMTLDQTGNPGSEVILIPFTETDITIHDGTLIGGFNGITLGQGVAPVPGGGDGRLIIERVTIKDPTRAGVNRTGTAPIGNGLTVRNCVIQGAGTHGIKVDNSLVSNAVVSFVAEDNVIQNVSGDGIRIDGPLFGKIVGNVIREAVSGGISVDLDLTNSDRNLCVSVQDNRIEEISGGSGITLEDVEGCVVSGNTIRKVSVRGIDLRNTDASIVSHNVITDAADDGIRLLSTSSDNLLMNNNVSANGNVGILVSGDRNELRENLLNSNLGNTSSGDNFLPGLQ